MSEETIQILVDMGFEKEKAEKSVSMTGNLGVEPAMEWLLAHNDQREPSTSQGNSTPNIGSEVNPSSSSSTIAKSYKCEDCNKLFTDTSALQYHSTRYGHSNFSESTEEKKPLTEEEKKEQKKKLEELLKEKRKQREAMEKTEEIEREKNRIRSGKDMTAAKKKLEEQNLKKIINERIRDKEEEKKARERVKAQIEADRLDRKIKFGQVSGQKQPKQVMPVASNQKNKSTNYTETKLQIRLTNGQTIVKTFNVQELLDAVKLYIDQNRSDGDSAFRLMTNFPRKVFTIQDHTKTLSELGLVPSAVIILTQSPQ